MPDGNGGWDIWSKYLIKGMESLNSRFQKVEEDIIYIKIEISALKTKAGIFGLLGGILATAVIKFVFNEAISNP